MLSVRVKKELPMGRSLEDIFSGYEGEMKFCEPMAPYTSLKVGGAADLMVFPKDTHEVADLMKRIAPYSLPVFMLGAGSNLLVRDGGLPGVVISLRHLNRIARVGETRLLAQGGVMFPRLSLYAMGCGLSGLEFAVGIPGTVGGAVEMNAGIPGMETQQVLTDVTVVDDRGDLERIPREYIRFDYRSSDLPWGPVVSATFALSPAPLPVIESRVRELLARRRETQPLTFPNMGSVFKNPPGDYAGRLIESVGMKGHRIGDAQVSEKHGNFIVNRGKASAREVLLLIQKVKEKVRRERGIQMALEVRVVGRE